MIIIPVSIKLTVVCGFKHIGHILLGGQKFYFLISPFSAIITLGGKKVSDKKVVNVLSVFTTDVAEMAMHQYQHLNLLGRLFPVFFNQFSSLSESRIEAGGTAEVGVTIPLAKALESLGCHLYSN